MDLIWISINEIQISNATFCRYDTWMNNYNWCNKSSMYRGVDLNHRLPSCCCWILGLGFSSILPSDHDIPVLSCCLIPTTTKRCQSVDLYNLHDILATYNDANYMVQHVIKWYDMLFCLTFIDSYPWLKMLNRKEKVIAVVIRLHII